MDSLIAHVEFDQETGSYTSSNKNSVVEKEATLVPFSPRPDPRNPKDIPGNQSTWLKIFPDSGATICLGGPKHLHCMGLKESNLVPSKKVIRAVGGSTLISQGWLPVQFSVGEMLTKQALYICNNINKLYFSKATSIDVGILSPHFPTSMSLTNQRQVNFMTNDHMAAVCLPNMEQKQSTNFQLPIHPEEPPFPANKENVENLKKWLLEQFANSAFKTDRQFPAMSGKPAYIHLKQEAIPKAKHRPIPVPYHLKEPVRQALMQDIERGILKQVPIGTPTDWCSTIVISTKRDGRPRGTIDYQYLNLQCK